MDPLGATGRVEILGDGVGAPSAHAEPLVELAQGRDAAGAGRHRESRLGHAPGEADEILSLRALEIAVDILGEVRQIADVGETGVETSVFPFEVGPPLQQQRVGGWNRRAQVPPSGHRMILRRSCNHWYG